MPVSALEISAGWLQRALLPAFPGVSVEAFKAKRLGEGYGLASSIYRYRWETGEPPHSVTVKLWSIDGPGGTREVQFYRSFGKAVGARIPDCFYAAIDPVAKRGVLVLEDLTPFIQGDCLLKLSKQNATAVAQNLAGIHAFWLAHPGLEEAAWLPSVARWEREADWFARRRRRFLERFGHLLDNRAEALLDRVVEAQAVAHERLAGAAMSLLHNDLHLDNLVFLHGKEPVFLDWARCAKGPFVLDLYDLLFPMIHVVDRQQVLASYLDVFSERTGQQPEVADLWSLLGGVFLRKFALATCGVANWQPASKRESALIEVGLQRALSDLEYWAAKDPSLFAFL